MFTIINTLDKSILEEIMSIVKLAPLKEDVSSYAKGRQRTWLNMHWNLKDKTFDKQNCFRNTRLWEILLNIWPEAQIGLLTYSGKEKPIGINLHRDDSYADYESVGVQITGECSFEYLGGYRHFRWHADKDNEEKKVFNLKPGDVFRFNCKNRHSAMPSVDRYAINLWKISPKFRKEFDEASQPIIKPLF